MRDGSSIPPVIILGAGLTGLSAAYHLEGVPRVLVERAGEVGGKARSERTRGHTFDVTGHWLHLRDPRMQTLVQRLFADEAVPLARIDRVTRVFSHGALLSYPFQANLHGLPLDVVQECLVELVVARERAARGEARAPATFEEFAVARFGKGIARHFFVPYNTKLWGMSPDQLTADWVSRFIPIPDTAQIIGGALGLRQEGLGYNAHFLYPETGGIDHLPRALRRAAAQPRAPGLVQHREHAVGQRADEQCHAAPPQQRGHAVDGGEEQRAKSQREHHRGHRRRRQYARGRMGEPAVGEPADQRVGDGVEQPHPEQQRTERGQRDAERGRIVVRQDHVQRQRDEGQRQPEAAVTQPVGPAAAPGHVRVRHAGHRASPSSCPRSAGSEVSGASQMPKNRRAKSGSRSSPRARPLK